MPEPLRPFDIQVAGSRVIVYRKVLGVPAQDVDKVMHCAFDLWQTTSSKNLLLLETCHKEEYIDYVKRCKFNSPMCIPYHTGAQEKDYKWIWDTIMEADLTPVAYCHGDMTLENCIDTGGDGIVFIDPGYPRGLNCREIDQAKLLQSLRGWHELKGYPKPISIYNWRPIHFALYVTHLIRLLCHPELHTEVLLAWAVNEVKEMIRVR